MVLYRVALRGDNCLVDVEGRKQQLSFYTIRFVSAPDDKTACAIALKNVCGELRDKLSAGAERGVTVAVDSVQPSDGEISELPGFIWFRDG